MTVFKKKQGFTLVEILVALLVSGIIISAIYQIMINQIRVYTGEEQNIQVQQNARAALDFMARELRMAGFGVADDDHPKTNVFLDLINNAAKNTEMIDQGTDAVIFTAGVGHGSWIAEAVNPGSKTCSVKVYPATEECFEFERGTMTSPNFVDLIAHVGNEKYKLNKEPLKITGVRGPSDKEPLTTVTFEQILAEVLIDNAKGKGLVQGDQVVLCPQVIRYSVHEKVLKRSLSKDGGRTFSTVQSLINNVDDLQLSYSFDGSDEDHKADIDYPVTKTDLSPLIIWAIDAGSSGVLDNQIMPCGKRVFLDHIAYRADTTVINAPVTIGDPSYNPLRGVKLSLLVHGGRGNPDHRFRGLHEPLRVQDHEPDEGCKDSLRRRVFERKIPFRNLGLNPSFTNGNVFKD